MPRKYNIRWRETDEDQLRKAVKNYNAKISRLEKADPLGRGLLPRKASMETMRAKIETRQDYNRELRKLQSFSQRGGEYRYNWREDDEKAISQAVKGFNAKIAKISKADPKNAAALPEKMTVKQLKRNISSRQDLRKTLKALERFSKEGAEELVEIPGNNYNLKLTKWQKEEMERSAARVNKERGKRREELADVDLTSRGKKLGYKKGQIGMGRAEERALDPVEPFTKSMSRADLQRKMRQLWKEDKSGYWKARDELMRKNYIQALEENFNTKDIQDVIDTIEEMDFQEFRKVFEAEGGDFESMYPPDDEQYQGYLSSLKSTWLPQK